jgi:hypothetical protein
VRSGRSDADQRALDLPRVRSRPQQSGVMQETSNLRASSLYSLAWVRDSDKLPHSARGQHVDVRRMISARLRVPPLWCGVRAGNNTIDSRGLKRAKHAQMPPADPYSQDGSPHLPSASALALAQQWRAPARSWCRSKDDCRATRCSSE